MADYENGTPATTSYQDAREQLQQRQYRWVVTGAAGFIGSNLLQTLLELGQCVAGVDNFLTGYHHNLDQVRDAVGSEAWRRFELIEGDIRDMATCTQACDRADFVLHQAALGSVTRSLREPLLCNDINIGGWLNVLEAARLAGVRRIVYAASSASYGDHPALPKQEAHVGRALSPYALTKYVNELYADVYARCYGTETIGLRYFNVFGPRQDPSGAYAAVIPQWIAAMIGRRRLVINGDGESSRDFCYVANAVQANLLAALTDRKDAVNQVYNVALNSRTSLNELYLMLHGLLVERYPHLRDFQPEYGEFRAGDVRHSQADIAKARELLGYMPTHDLRRGLRQALRWYVHYLGG
ncbi:SDR family oxidoreductase [Rugamonas rivuli]|uniref:NAD-dependent epimerase/dehydratase family protein n=1 Tax=Rugamonas rivuli TaxID=2743358 RepID=A0A843S2P1_9BURK|nr:SDR family oxidoreductase [Rugamonas rivuli]MQA18379.1 NAD-dependent epimerase/dehydratase family protein [Rugamonas rivuli]